MSAKIFFASVIVSLLIMAPLAYFVLPVLYPDMKDGGTVQLVYQEFNATAYILDSTNDFELINQTSLTISTQGESQLSILYVMQCVLSLGYNMYGAVHYEIALVVSGVGNRTLKVAYYHQYDTGNYTEIPADVTINYVTGTLAAGNYTIGVYWRSVYDAVGGNSLIAHTTPNYEYVRTLQIEEIRT